MALDNEYHKEHRAGDDWRPRQAREHENSSKKGVVHGASEWNDAQNEANASIRVVLDTNVEK